MTKNKSAKKGITSEDAKIIAEQDRLHGVMILGIIERVRRRVGPDASDLLVDEEIEKESTAESKRALDMYIASAALQFVTFRQNRPHVAYYDE